MTRFVRRTLVALSLAALVILLLFALAHAPFARAWALLLLRDALEARGIIATSDRLDYNLARLDVSVNGLVLAARGHDAQPFLTVDEAHVRFAWSTVFGAIAIDAIELTRPHLALVQLPDGGFNLPRRDPESSAPSAMGEIRIGQVSIRDASFSVREPANEFSFEMPRFDVSLAPTGATTAGRIRMSGTALGTWEGHSFDVRTLEGALAFDGTNLALDTLRLESTEGAIELRGQLRHLLGDMSMDLDYAARTDLSQLSKWVALEPPAAGPLTVTGRVIGPPDDSTISIAPRGQQLSWREINGVGLTADATLRKGMIEIQALEANVAGGHVRGTAEIALDPDGSETSRLQLQWTGLNGTPLLRSAGWVAVDRWAAAHTGSLNARWTRPSSTALDARLENISRGTGRASSTAVPLDGRLVLTIRGGRWEASSDHGVAENIRIQGALAGALSDIPESAATLTGNIQIDVERVFDAARLLGLIDSRSIWNRADGRAEAQVTLSGTVAAPRYRAEVQADDLHLNDDAAFRLDARAAGDASALSLHSLRLETDTSRIAADGMIRLDRRSADLRFSASSARPLDFLPAGWTPFPIEGQVEAHGTLTGTVTTPAAHIALSGSDMMVAGQAIDRLSADMSISGGTIAVEPLLLTQPGGQLDVRGRYAIETGTFTADVNGQNFLLAPLVLQNGQPAVDVRGQLDVNLHAEGSLADPGASGVVEIRGFEYQGFVPGLVTAQVSAEPRANVIDIRLPDLPATLGVRLERPDWHRFSARGVAESVDLAALARRGAGWNEMPLSGSLSARAEANGDLQRLADAAGHIELTKLDAALGETPLRLARSATIGYDRSRISMAAVEILLGTTSLAFTGEVSPQADTKLSMTLAGDAADLVQAARAFAPASSAVRSLIAAGRIDASATAIGDWRRPNLQGTLVVNRAMVGIPDLPPARDVTIDAEFDQGVVRVRRLDAEWQDAHMTATGEFPVVLLRDRFPSAYLKALPPAVVPARITARIEPVTPATLAPLVDPASIPDIAGTVAASIDLSARSAALDAIEGEVRLDRAEMVLAGVQLAQRQPTRLVVSGGRLRIAQWDWGGPSTTLALHGGTTLRETDNEIDVAALAAVDLRIASAFLPDARTAGRAELSMTAKGPLGSPLLNGQVTFEDAEVRVAAWRMVLARFGGTVRLDGERLSSETLTGVLNGGTIEVSGDVRHARLEPVGGNVSIVARGVAMAVPEGLRSQVDADLQLSIDADRPVLKGTVTVVRGTYREPLSLTSGLLAALRTQDTGGEPAAPSRLNALDLNIRVLTADPVIVDNNYGRLQATADLRLVGTASQPALAGRMTILEGGQVYVGGNVYRIERGSIDFTGTTPIEPDLTLTARTRVQNHDIQLALSGTPETLEASLTSDDPQLTQGDLVSLLVTGRTLSETGGAETEIARDQALSYLSGELLSRTLGFDSIRVERGIDEARFDPVLIASETDPGARLTVGEDIGDEFHFVYSQSLNHSGDFTIIAGYHVRPNLEVRLVTDDDEDRSYEFRHDISFGAPPTLSRPAVKQLERQTVRSVRFVGDPGFMENERAARIDVAAGDRFDFFAWQEDRDGLERFYHDRGFFEAQVRTRQIPASEDVVDLEYDIRRGPLCSVRVEGYPAARGLREEIERAWTRAVFDEFLIDEATFVTRRQLAASGHVQATVEARLEPAPAAKELVIAVVPGTRVSRKTIQFTGIEHVTEAQLQRVIREGRLTETAWIDPRALANAIEAFYRGEGFPAAAVSVGQPGVTGREAILPVAVHEGPPFTISTIVLEGVAAIEQATAREALGMAVGDRYQPRLVENARRALDNLYRRSGFNAARISVRTGVEREPGTAEIRFVVNEGAQQILRDIRVAGAGGTRPSVVSRALDLTLGEPVNLAELNLARRRVYDTNVFRRVDIEVEPIPNAPTQEAEGSSTPIEAVRANITVEEWPRYRFRYGLQLLDEEKPTGEGRQFEPGFAGDLTRRNLFARAASAGASLRYSPDFQVVRGYISTPRLFGLPVTSYLFVSRSHESFGDETSSPFVTNQVELTAEQRFRIGQPVQVSYNYSFERNHTFDPDADPDDPLAFDLTIDIARLNGTILFDTRDDLVSPARGWFHSSSVEYASEALGSSLRFAKYLVQQQYYRPFPHGIVFASAARTGFASAFEQELIPSERFFAGGGTSVRGYREDSLGPQTFFGDAAGGNALLVLNEEIRFPVYRWIGGVGFVDAGNTFAKISDWSITDLRASVGLGLRLHTPVMLVRIDFGMPLDPDPGEPFGRWFFSLGQAF